MIINKIAVITAMKSEYNAVLKIATQLKKISDTKTTCLIGKRKTVVILSGVGKVSGALATQETCLNDKVGLIINCGMAGAIDKSIAIGDIVMANSIAYHDVDITTFGYKLGEIPGLPEEFNPIVLAHPRVKIGLIVSGDQFVEKKLQKKIKKNFPKALAVEMEAGGIAQAAFALKVPYLIIRSISDNTRNAGSKIEFKKFELKAAKEAALIIKEIIEGQV